MVFIGKTKVYLLHLSTMENPFIYARKLRKRQTEAEKILWHKLIGRNCSGYKFRRQHPILHYITDFYCHEQRLVIELDGGIHQFQLQADLNRTAEIERLGIRVLRFKNEEILHSPEGVKKAILFFIEQNPYR